MDENAAIAAEHYEPPEAETTLIISRQCS